MSKFDELLNELETLAKAQTAADVDPGDDDKIKAAAAEGDADDGDDDDDDGYDEIMGKAMTVEIDGEEMQAVDATEFAKGLMVHIDKSKQATNARLDRLEGMLTKALEVVTAATKRSATEGAEQEALIKSLQGQVEAMSKAGSGRRAVLSVHEKPAAGVKDEEPSMDRGEFMSKALQAQKAGRIGGGDVARVESYLNRGLNPPADIIQKVIGD